MKKIICLALLLAFILFPKSRNNSNGLVENATSPKRIT